MEYVRYEVLQDEVLVTRGECPTFFLNSLTDLYCDFKNSPYKLKIFYKDKMFEVSSPPSFNNTDINE